MPLCLIVARDPAYAATLAAEIERCGLRAYRVEGAAAALAAAGQCRFDAVAIDGDGFLATLPQALAELRARLPAPILVLTSCADEERQIAALDCGANEVHLKPSSGRLVAAKLRRLIDLGPPPAAPAPPREVRLGALRLEPGRAGASVGDAALPLTAGEFDLLLLLASQAGQFVHRDHIARALHGPGGAANGEPRRSADMHVCRIRRKLREAGAFDIALDTVYGRGYLLRLDPARSAAMPLDAVA